MYFDSLAYRIALVNYSSTQTLIMGGCSGETVSLYLLFVSPLTVRDHDDTAGPEE